MDWQKRPPPSSAAGTPSMPLANTSSSHNNSPQGPATSPTSTSHPPPGTRAPIAPHGLNPRSCNTCRRRKVKCDKTYPCANCTKAHTECVFPGPGRAPRRMKAPKASSERETELLKRLRRLEGVVEELSGQVEIEAARTGSSPGTGAAVSHEIRSESIGSDVGPDGQKSKSQTIRVRGMDEGNAETRTWLNRIIGMGEGPPKSSILDKTTAKIVVDEGKSHYISNEFWMRLNMEVADIRELADDYSDHQSEDDEATPDSALLGVDSSAEENHQAFILGYSSSTVDLRPLHPLPSQIPFYWQTFMENVDPLVKIIHKPTMSNAIKEYQDNLGSLSRSTEALMFAIYLGAITSMSVEEVKINLGLDKPQLLNKYRFATEQALARANFLTSTEIVTVQAFVLFLVCVRRHDDSRTVWSLSGLATRLAQAIGLHRDGEALGLSVFDTEMRRRLWWQICMLDVRSAEDFGTEAMLSKTSSDVKLPSNYNDEDFSPEKKEWPEPRVGVSEMTFCLIRYEICDMIRDVVYRPLEARSKTAAPLMDLADKEKAVRRMQNHLEKTYLQYCDSAGPLYWVAATVSRLVMSKMSLIIYGFRDPELVDQLPQAVKDRLFIAATEIMEYSRLLETESATKQWGWLFHTYVQWHAIAYILREICVRPSCEISERGWRSVDVVFESWSHCLRTHRANKQLWNPLRKLMIKAKRKRQADMEQREKEKGTTVSGDTNSGSRFRMNPDTGTVGQQWSTGEGPANGQESIPGSNLAVEESDDSIWKAYAPQPELPVNGAFMGPLQTANQNGMQPQYLDNNTILNSGLRNTAAPWLVDGSALIEMDLGAGSSGLDMGLDPMEMNMDLDDIDWAGWDDAVREFGVQNDPAQNRGPDIGSLGVWW